MSVEEIIKAVRWCVDEESNNSSAIIDDKEDAYMDNIIKAKIPDALHWIAITATASSVLSGSSDTKAASSVSVSTDISVELYEDYPDIGIISMPSNIAVFNINRVRARGWHKGVVPMEDTDDEELLMFDESSKGTADRPLAAIMRVSPLKLLVQPVPEDRIVTVSYVGVPTQTSQDENNNEVVNISDTFRNALIYYIAFLLLSAYDDTKATQMYSIALQQLGVNQTAK